MTDTSILPHHIRVTRTARYYTLGGRGDRVDEVWFAFHGYRQAARRFARRFEVLDAPERIVVVPEALSRFYVDPSPGRHGPEHRVGASWMTREDRDNEIADYVAYLDALAGEVGATAASAARRRVVLGFSQGAHTASRWVVLGHRNVHELVLWGAGLATDLTRDALAAGLEAVQVTFVRGARDQFRDRREEEAQEAILKELGVSFRVLVHPGEHEIAPEPLLAVAEAEVLEG
ncbi:MAG: phospholipase [Gammaproteobacteria bacterium]|nr:phospholipase [Gammaproteobacteria bacterium]